MIGAGYGRMGAVVGIGGLAPHHIVDRDRVVPRVRCAQYANRCDRWRGGPEARVGAIAWRFGDRQVPRPLVCVDFFVVTHAGVCIWRGVSIPIIRIRWCV